MTAYESFLDVAERAGIEVAWVPSPWIDLEGAIGGWVAAFCDAAWQRSRDDEGRPGWDADMDAAADAGALAEEVRVLVTRRLAEFGERYQSLHPEAALRA
jgi:hypothetical protein